MSAGTAQLVEAKAAKYQNEKAVTLQDVSNPANDPDALGEASGATMKALTYTGKNSVKLVDVPKPKILEDRDAIIRVTGSTVCGSDLHLFHGVVPETNKGDILGHEFCGVVESLAPRVRNVSVGDRVVASFQIACGSCWYCDRKLSSQCCKTNASATQEALLGAQTAGIFGYSHITGGFAGGQAEYVRVPFADVNLLKLPRDVPDERGLFISDVLATSYHAVHDTGVAEGDVVAIWGVGPIGQMAASYALQAGASRVICIDKVAWRLQRMQHTLAGQAGKIQVLDLNQLSKNDTVVKVLKRMVDGRGPDVAIECAAGEYAKGSMHAAEIASGLETDTSELLNEAIESVRNFGRVGVTGVYAGFTNHFNIGSLMQRGVRLIGNGQAPVHMYWDRLLSLVREGKIEPLEMVSHRVRLEDLEEVYKRFDARDDGLQKVYVQTRFSAEPAPGSPLLTTY